MTAPPYQLRNRSPYRSRPPRRSGQWTPAHLSPYAWYDANYGGSPAGIADISGNGRADIVNGAGSNAALFLPYNGSPTLTLQSSDSVRHNTGAAAWPTFPAGEFTVVLDMSSSDWNPASGIRRRLYIHDGTYNIIFLSYNTTSYIFGAGVPVMSTGHPASGRVQWRFKRNANVSAEIAWRTDGVTDPTASGWTVSGSGVLTDSLVYAQIGDSSDTSEGTVYSVNMYDSTGALRVEYDPVLSTQTSYVDPVSGTTWLNYRTATGRKLVIQSPSANSAEALFLLGPDDFLTVPLDAMPPLGASDSMAAILVSRQWASSGAYALDISDASPDIGRGIKIETAGTTLYAVRGDGTATVTPTRAQTLGQRNVFVAAYTPTAVRAYLNSGSNVGSAAHSLGSSTPTRAGKIGGLIAGGGNVDMEFRALIMLNREPTAAEIDQVAAWYGAGL